MVNDKNASKMPPRVAMIAECGYAIWASEDVDPGLRARFDNERIPVAGVRNVRVWGLQVDDERTLPGRERTSIPDEEVWEVNLEAKSGQHYEFDASLLRAAP